MFKQNVTQYSIIAIAVVVGFTTQAKVPEPDTVLYGKVFHTKNIPLVPLEGDTVEIIALREDNGEELARATLEPNASTGYDYVLRIPMDDGKNQRIPKTAKGGDTIQVYVKNITKDLEDLAPDIVLDAARGTVTNRNLVVEANIQQRSLDKDFMADDWEIQYSVPTVEGVIPLSLSMNDDDQDNDKDGISNVEEYIAGTNPLDKDNYFRILDVEQDGSLYQVKCGPVKQGKQYMVQFKEGLLVPEWTTLVRIDALNDSDYLSWAFNIEGSEQGVFQAVVEMK